MLSGCQSAHFISHVAANDHVRGLAAIAFGSRCIMHGGGSSAANHERELYPLRFVICAPAVLATVLRYARRSHLSRSWAQKGWRRGTQLRALRTDNPTAAPRLKIADLWVGQEVCGKVISIVPNLGVYLDIGAEERALCKTKQLKMSINEYAIGDDVSGFKVSALDARKRQIDISALRLPRDVQEGEYLKGTVLRPVKFGVFFDAGLAEDVLGPQFFLERPPKDYEVGEVLDLFVVSAACDEKPWITVTTRSKEVIQTLIELESIISDGTIAQKTFQLDLGLNFVINYGVTRDAFYALWRPQDSDTQKTGKVEGITLAQLDWNTGQVNLVFASVDGKQFKEFKIYSEVPATILRVTRFGLFCDIGAECDALWPRAQLPKEPWEYKVGETLTGLKLVTSEPSRNVLTLSDRKTAADFVVGDQVSGCVTNIRPGGLQIDIGASREAFAPGRLLSRKLDRYQRGQAIRLKIAELNVDKNEIVVGQAASAAMSIEEFARKEGLL